METESSLVGLLTRLSFVTSILMLLLTIAGYSRFQPEIPLFYSLPRSEQALIAKGWIFLLPLLSISINAVHYLFSRFSLARQPHSTVLTFFWGATLTMQVLLISAWLRIILITW